ncbi:MEMO1 family protein [Paragonimus westermani]|uniref:MEMO1 family protein n=1 Tax=Paragonimus westermani TaxID=34504 RepID=A0A5J4NUQ5_9TREM|nr:MEMO1 family protein [Paragonimus westermani]
MSAIETLNPAEFTSYLQKYHNTICGRRAISILLNAIQTTCDTQSGFRCQLRFLHYAQSSRCQTMNDSSVSYAAASLVFR